MKYSLETLEEMNRSFEPMLSEREVEIANDLSAWIEETRSTKVPKAGDLLIFTDDYGEYHPHAHIEYTTEDRYGGNVCDNGSCAHIGKTVDGIWCNGSGGPWSNIPVDKMRYVGKGEETFWTWGSYGAGAHRGIYFKATVSVWTYDNPNLKPSDDGIVYTTKDYDKFYVHKVDHRKRDSIYDYTVTKNAMPHTAFKDKESYDAWLWTFKGKIVEKNWLDEDIVWTWKRKEHSVSPREFESLDLPEDTMLNNARILRCKRKYDEENHIVHTYYVWYWEEKGDFYENLSKQNEIRDKYYTLPIGSVEYALARKEMLRNDQ